MGLAPRASDGLRAQAPHADFVSGAALPVGIWSKAAHACINTMQSNHDMEERNKQRINLQPKMKMMKATIRESYDNQ